MFLLLRSAFWLTLAFLIIRPAGVDFQGAADAVSSRAMASGQQLLVEQLLPGTCAGLECAAGAALLNAALPQVQPPAPQSQTEMPLPPVPRPRPARAG